MLLLCDTAAEGQSDKMASDIYAPIKQRRVTEFLHAQKMATADTDQWLLNFYGDQTVDMSTVKQWVVHFSSGEMYDRYEPESKWQFMKWQHVNSQ